MRDRMCAGIVVVVAAATTSPCLGATQHDGAASPPRPSGIILAQAAPKATSPATVARAITVVISGKVQGVGFRDWVVGRAKALGVRGWVENGKDGTVHALFGGGRKLPWQRCSPHVTKVRAALAFAMLSYYRPISPTFRLVSSGATRLRPLAAGRQNLVISLFDLPNIRRHSFPTLPPIDWSSIGGSYSPVA
jgi:acylphosphatase